MLSLSPFFMGRGQGEGQLPVSCPLLPLTPTLSTQKCGQWER
jgi:hypothetical protein